MRNVVTRVLTCMLVLLPRGKSAKSASNAHCIKVDRKFTKIVVLSLLRYVEFLINQQ